jgi:hypothetical protein
VRKSGGGDAGGGGHAASQQGKTQAPRAAGPSKAPTVVPGGRCRMGYAIGSTWRKVPFESEVGKLALEVTFESD